MMMGRISLVLLFLLCAIKNSQGIEHKDAVLNKTCAENSGTTLISIGCFGKKIFYKETVQVLKLNWFNAWEYCRDHGMHLASVDSLATHRFINDRLVKPGDGSEIRYWTSGTDMGTENSFIWMNSGREFGYTKWAPRQPDNYDRNEDCVELWFHDRHSPPLKFMFNDHLCDLQSFLICEESV